MERNLFPCWCLTTVIRPRKTPYPRARDRVQPARPQILSPLHPIGLLRFPPTLDHLYGSWKLSPPTSCRRVRNQSKPPSHPGLSRILAPVGSQEVVEHTHKLALLICQVGSPLHHNYWPTLHDYLLPNLHIPIVWGGTSLNNGITSCDPTSEGILDNQGWSNCMRQCLTQPSYCWHMPCHILILCNMASGQLVVWGTSCFKLSRCLITSLQQKRMYTSLGSSCPTCVHQIEADNQWFFPALSWTLVYACWTGRT